VTAEALVIGGGPAGASLAARLARAGREVRLFEREAAAHDKVCGEFLSVETLRLLDSLDLSPVTLGAIRIRALRVAHRGRMIERDLPFPAWSLTRRVLDEALLGAAAGAGASISRGARVLGLERDGGSWRATLAGGGEVAGRSVFLATGKQDLRGWKRPPGRHNDLVGFKQFWRLTSEQQRALAGYVELHPFGEGYAGLQPVEGGRANLCLVIERRRLLELGGRWPDVVAALVAEAPLLATRLEAALPLDRPLAITSIPYGLVRRLTEGPWYLGDQAAVIPSLTGDGIAMALAGAARAADSFLRGDEARVFQASLGRDLVGQVGRATLMSRAITTEIGAGIMMAALRLWPGLAAVMARSTRLPSTRFALPDGRESL
jgi:flavin-dependent dehydrogenase